MALYKVIFRNDTYKPGTWLETIEDESIGEEYVQPVHMVQEGSRLIKGANYGVMLPLRNVRDVCIKMLKRGLDKRW